MTEPRRYILTANGLVKDALGPIAFYDDAKAWVKAEVAAARVKASLEGLCSLAYEQGQRDERARIRAGAAAMWHGELPERLRELIDGTAPQDQHPLADVLRLSDDLWSRKYGMCGGCGKANECCCGGCKEGLCRRCPERIATGEVPAPAESAPQDGES